MLILAPWQGQSQLVRGARLYLGVCSIIVFALSVLLITLGINRNWTNNLFLLNPFLSIVVIGATAIPTAVLCGAGALTANRLILFVYMLTTVLIAVVLLYISILCFVFQQFFETDLKTAGAVCIVAFLALACSVGAAAIVGGWNDWARPKMPGLLNAVLVILASLFLYIAVYVDRRENTTDARFAITVAGLVLVNSLEGCVAIITRWVRAFKAHALGSLVLGMLCIIVAAACISAGTVLSHSNEVEASESDRLMLVGSYALIAAMVIFLECGFLVHEIMTTELPFEFAKPTESIP